MKNRITLCLLSAVLSVSLVMPSVVWASGEDTSDFQSLEGEFDLEESFEETRKRLDRKRLRNRSRPRSRSRPKSRTWSRSFLSRPRRLKNRCKKASPRRSLPATESPESSEALSTTQGEWKEEDGTFWYDNGGGQRTKSDFQKIRKVTGITLMRKVIWRLAGKTLREICIILRRQVATDSAAVCSLAFRISILVHSVLIVPGYFRLAGKN